MSAGTAILILVAVLVVAPVTAYLVMKFGATGFYRAKQRQQDKKEKDHGKRET